MDLLCQSAAFDALLKQIPEREAIGRTAALADVSHDRCNLEILNGYIALSNAFGRLLHGVDATPDNATFATFAAWAAVTLRREAVLDDQVVDPMHPARSVYRAAAKLLLAGDDAIARNIVRGQAAVYEEIGSAIYSLITRVCPELIEDPVAGSPQDSNEDQSEAGNEDQSQADHEDWWTEVWTNVGRDLLSTQAKLNACRGSTEALDDGSVTLLQRAVRPYFLILQMDLARPCLEADAQKKRAEMILLGNLRMVAYEQARLQPVFERNLSYVPNLFRNALANSLGRRASLMHAYRRAFTRVRNATEIINEAFQIAASRRVFSMIVGTEDLSFGRDLPVPPPANLLLRNTQPDADRGRYRRGAFFPSELNVLLEPSVWAEWQRYDRSSGNGGRTAVNDWLRYGERMSFIVNAFRSRQQLIGLYDVPTSIPPEAAAPGAAPGAPTLRARPAPRQPGPLDQPLDLSLNTQQRLHDKFAEKRP